MMVQDDSTEQSFQNTTGASVSGASGSNENSVLGPNSNAANMSRGSSSPSTTHRGNEAVHLQPQGFMSSNGISQHHNHRAIPVQRAPQAVSRVPPSPPLGIPIVPNLNLNAVHAAAMSSPHHQHLPIPPGSPILSNDFELHDPNCCPSSPYVKASKSAVETALVNERERIKILEEEEANYTTIEEFKAALKKERQYSKNIVSELAALKSIAVTSTLEAEIHEEGRINCLMRRLDILQKEKGRIIVELEREEEMVSQLLKCLRDKVNYLFM